MQHPFQHQPMPNPVFPQIHPAHPLVNQGGLGRDFDRDDLLEMHSFITAHRSGFDESNFSIINDDVLERQSFITDYRQGFDKKQWVRGEQSDASSTGVNC
jgi:hypothetical protein